MNTSMLWVNIPNDTQDQNICFPRKYLQQHAPTHLCFISRQGIMGLTFLVLPTATEYPPTEKLWGVLPFYSPPALFCSARVSFFKVFFWPCTIRRDQTSALDWRVRRPYCPDRRYAFRYNVCNVKPRVHVGQQVVQACLGKRACAHWALRNCC